ncbi:Hsp20/alpha crystallin family protein [Paenibacillus doosanensis]|uniref:Hsp20/alpha crystallin family protein n=1 Tax=Paenibacillus doosanensis TaxID=1229154 RepID=UPI00217FFF36|nr:Hsp20/alpha crystallin family protein [Paenibacillus doosanensis]MCS7464413.1 Hsp20/alpha crystallin family protein [Paenibacillus doosanensis]
MDKNHNPLNGFDWKQFEQSFGSQMNELSQQWRGAPTWVEDYVRNVLEQTLPNTDYTARTGPYQTEIEETHQHVRVNIQVPDPNTAKQLKVYVAPRQMKIEYKGEHGIQLIRLPQLVIPSSCKAVYKEGILQIHIRKDDMDEQFREVDIRFM